MTIIAAYQGIEGAHSEIVLGQFMRAHGLSATSLGVATFREVATSVISGKADVGLLPIDNAIAGTIRDGYDLLAQFDLAPRCEIQWRMDHRLLGLPGAVLSEIREVLAHPLVVAECGRFIGTLSAARVIPSPDTGVAARDVAEGQRRSRAAIAPPEAAERYGLVELSQNLADHPDNFTRFVLFSAQASRPELRALCPDASTRRKTSLLLATRHEQGALARCLGILADAEINLAKLESRPLLGRAWEYQFYVDLFGDQSEPRVATALGRLQQHTTSLQVLGSYGVFEDWAAPRDATAFEVSASARPPDEPQPELPAAAAKNYPKAARGARAAGTRIPFGTGVTVGGDEFVVIAGPCSVESRDQMLSTARAVVQRGARALRGGAFKPRTNPYSFQGLGWDGVALLAEAGRLSQQQMGFGRKVRGKEALSKRDPLSGYGLTAMRERSEIFGGSFDIDSEIGKGTKIKVSLPIHE